MCFDSNGKEMTSQEDENQFYLTTNNLDETSDFNNTEHKDTDSD